MYAKQNGSDTVGNGGQLRLGCLGSVIFFNVIEKVSYAYQFAAII